MLSGQIYSFTAQLIQFKVMQIRLITVIVHELQQMFMIFWKPTTNTELTWKNTNRYTEKPIPTWNT